MPGVAESVRSSINRSRRPALRTVTGPRRPARSPSSAGTSTLAPATCRRLSPTCAQGSGRTDIGRSISSCCCRRRCAQATLCLRATLAGRSAPAPPRPTAGGGRRLRPRVRAVASLRAVDAERPRRERAGRDRGNAILSTLPPLTPAALELPFVRQRRVAVLARLGGLDDRELARRCVYPPRPVRRRQPPVDFRGGRRARPAGARHRGDLAAARSVRGRRRLQHLVRDQRARDSGDDARQRPGGANARRSPTKAARSRLPLFSTALVSARCVRTRWVHHTGPIIIRWSAGSVSDPTQAPGLTQRKPR